MANHINPNTAAHANSIRIRTATIADLPSLTTIAATAPDPWQEADLSAALEDTSRLLLFANSDGTPAGFACFRMSTDAVEASTAIQPNTGTNQSSYPFTTDGTKTMPIRDNEENADRQDTPAELEMLVVLPALRQKGIGKTLLAEGLTRLAPTHTRCLLEVRASNTAALGLYEASGFRILARRPALYAHPREDGLLLETTLQKDST